MTGSRSHIPPHFASILSNSFLLRTSATGRKTGLTRITETTFHWDGDSKVILSGYPGKRHWVANMKANPKVMVHTVQGLIWYDIAATARIVSAEREREKLLLGFIDHWASQARSIGVCIRSIVFFAKVMAVARVPYWGPLLPLKSIIRRMPCVELTFESIPALRSEPPPEKEIVIPG